MYELIQAGDRTYYIDSPSKIGVIRETEKEVWLVDSGNNKDAGRKVMKILEQNNWRLKGIINTHGNADHIGGNKLIAGRTGCKILCTAKENPFIQNPVLSPSFLYGGFPLKELKNHFLLAEESQPEDIRKASLPEGVETIGLPGHFFGMIGVKTPDDIYFLGDCLFGENIIDKYHVFFIYDVRAFLDTLDRLEGLQGKLYIPSHAKASPDIRPLVRKNRDKVFEINDKILHICREKIIFEDILKRIFDEYELVMDFNQYVLVGNTVRSYLSCLADEGRLGFSFEGNHLYWKAL